MPKRNPNTASTASRTIPGQSLLPSELLKRHLAGTLPDIDHSKRYEYHYDEHGEQVAEPLPIEFHEFHSLAVAIRKRQFEEATERKRQQTDKFKQRVIDEYIKSKQPASDPITDPEPNAPKS